MRALIAFVGGSGDVVVCGGKVGRVVTAGLSHNSHIVFPHLHISTPPNFLLQVTAKNK
jgi:hypothetical protein